MIRSTKSSLKFTNAVKQDGMATFLSEYGRVVTCFIDILWDKDRIPVLLPKEITSKVSTWLSARAVQCAAKQASAVVRGTRQKQSQRQYVVKKLNKEGQFGKARKLQKIIDNTKISKPSPEAICPELDSRFVKIDLSPTTKQFDVWVTLGSLGNKLKLVLPLKKTRHFKKLLSKGTIKNGVRLSEGSITFAFDLPEPVKKTSGRTTGLDIGIKSVWTTSDGLCSKPDKHGHTLESIQQKLSRRKKGSVGFREAQTHRKNHINWSLNQLNLKGVKQLNIENLKDVRRCRKSSRLLSHWTYPCILGKLERLCQTEGVLLNKVSSAYTSLRCSACGWVHRTDRSGKRFKCKSCGFATDADSNASWNIGLSLEAVTYKKCLSSTGFYWLTASQEFIVPDTQKSVQQ